MPKPNRPNPELMKLEKLEKAERRDYPDLEVLHQSVTVIEGYACVSLIYRCELPTGDDVGTHVQIRWAVATPEGRTCTGVASWFEKENE